MGKEQFFLGIFLVIIAMILWVYAIPSMTTTLDTSDGTALENVSDAGKQAFDLTRDIFLPFMGLVLVAVGFAFIIKAVS